MFSVILTIDRFLKFVLRSKEEFMVRSEIEIFEFDSKFATENTKQFEESYLIYPHFEN